MRSEARAAHDAYVIVACEQGQQPVGWAVDEVLEVRTISDTDIQPAPAGTSDVIDSIVDLDGNIAPMIDPAKLYSLLVEEELAA